MGNTFRFSRPKTDRWSEVERCLRDSGAVFNTIQRDTGEALTWSRQLYLKIKRHRFKACRPLRSDVHSWHRQTHQLQRNQSWHLIKVLKAWHSLSETDIIESPFWITKLDIVRIPVVKHSIGKVTIRNLFTFQCSSMNSFLHIFSTVQYLHELRWRHNLQLSKANLLNLACALLDKSSTVV